jgi:hypothetical protein
VSDTGISLLSRACFLTEGPILGQGKYTGGARGLEEEPHGKVQCGSIPPGASLASPKAQASWKILFMFWIKIKSVKGHSLQLEANIARCKNIHVLLCFPCLPGRKGKWTGVIGNQCSGMLMH